MSRYAKEIEALDMERGATQEAFRRARGNPGGRGASRTRREDGAPAVEGNPGTGYRQWSKPLEGADATRAEIEGLLRGDALDLAQARAAAKSHRSGFDAAEQARWLRLIDEAEGEPGGRAARNPRAIYDRPLAEQEEWNRAQLAEHERRIAERTAPPGPRPGGNFRVKGTEHRPGYRENMTRAEAEAFLRRYPVTDGWANGIEWSPDGRSPWEGVVSRNPAPPAPRPPGGYYRIKGERIPASQQRREDLTEAQARALHQAYPPGPEDFANAIEWSPDGKPPWRGVYPP